MIEMTYDPGDYVKVEFPDETTGIAEWMWVRVHHCDEEKQLVFGMLDNEPLNEDTSELGSELCCQLLLHSRTQGLSLST
jgi:hypothetical protein